MHALNFYRPVLPVVLSAASLLKMLFKWQSFAGFVASSELSLVATSELSQKFFLHVFLVFK